MGGVGVEEEEVEVVVREEVVVEVMEEEKIAGGGAELACSACSACIWSSMLAFILRTYSSNGWSPSETPPSLVNSLSAATTSRVTWALNEWRERIDASAWLGATPSIGSPDCGHVGVTPSRVARSITSSIVACEYVWPEGRTTTGASSSLLVVGSVRSATRLSST